MVLCTNASVRIIRIANQNFHPSLVYVVSFLWCVKHVGPANFPIQTNNKCCWVTAYIFVSEDNRVVVQVSKFDPTLLFC